MAEPGFGEPELADAEDLPNVSPVADLLAIIRRQLTNEFRALLARELPCPRLTYGLMAVSSADPSSEAEQAVRVLFAARHVDHDATRWWENRNVGEAGSWDQRLTAVARDFHARRDEVRRAMAHEHLVAALIADVKSAYGWLWRHQGDPWPLVLLANVHVEAGDHFIGAYEKVLAAVATADGRSPLAVVGTALGTSEEPGPGTASVRSPMTSWPGCSRTMRWETARST